MRVPVYVSASTKLSVRLLAAGTSASSQSKCHRVDPCVPYNWRSRVVRATASLCRLSCLHLPFVLVDVQSAPRTREASCGFRALPLAVMMATPCAVAPIAACVRNRRHAGAQGHVRNLRILLKALLAPATLV